MILPERFQFLKGTIKTTITTTLSNNYRKFQFLKGTIKTMQN